MNTGKPNDLEERLFALSLRIVRLYQKLSKNSELGGILGKQLLRSATSIGANYQEGRPGKVVPISSAKQHRAKGSARNSLLACILIGSNEFAANLLSDLLDECEQIKRILGAIVGRCKQKDRKARTPAAE